MQGPNADFLRVVQNLFATGWRFMTCFRIPGTNVKPGEFFMAMVFVWLVLRKVLPMILGAQSPSRDSSGGGDSSGKSK